MQITPSQIRAARALLDWNQQFLAEKVGMTKHTISKIERGDITGGAKTLDNIYKTFIQAGIEFLPDEGVKKSSHQISSYSGYSGFHEFYDDIDETAKKEPNQPFLISNVIGSNFLKWLSNEKKIMHRDIILKHKIKYQILTQHSDTHVPAQNFDAQYKWIPKDQFYSVPYYVYGDKVALISFEEDSVDVFVIQHKSIVDLCRRQFQEMWDRAKDIPKDVQLDSSFIEK